jgi:ADP-ribosylglycohydrolase
MMLELAVGDAYGAGFEYAKRNIISAHNDLTKYIQHQKHNIAPGNYTDDAQMSIAIAEVLLSGDPWTSSVLAAKFVEAFKRDEREGYAGRFYDFLKEISSGDEFLQKIHPQSDKSGAAMRACPIGVLSDTEQVIAYATIQAKLTHDTPVGTNAAVAAALMPHYFLHQAGRKDELRDYISQQVPGNWKSWRGEVGGKGDMIVRAAITAVIEEKSLSAILKRSIAFGGDVDTVATIAMAAASCCKDIKQDIPAHLINALENNAYGRSHLEDLDRRLTQKYL